MVTNQVLQARSEATKREVFPSEITISCPSNHAQSSRTQASTSATIILHLIDAAWVQTLSGRIAYVHPFSKRIKQTPKIIERMRRVIWSGAAHPETGAELIATSSHNR